MPSLVRALLMVLGLSSAALGAIVPRAAHGQAAQPAPPPRKVWLFDIPALPLHQALERFSAVTGGAVMYNSHLADSRRSSPVVGIFPSEVALRMLLGNADLVIRYTSPTDVMLVSAAEAKAEAEEAAAIAVPGGPTGGASLALGTLYIETPPGDPARLDFSAYGQAVQAELKRALAKQPAMLNRTYQVQIDIWVNHLGALKHPRLVKSSGRADVDEVIRRTIEGITLKNPPPKGLPQPVRITIISI